MSFSSTSPLLTAAEIAAHLGVSPSSCRRILRRVGCRPLVLGHRTVRWDRDQVLAALARVAELTAT